MADSRRRPAEEADEAAGQEPLAKRQKAEEQGDAEPTPAGENADAPGDEASDSSSSDDESDTSSSSSVSSESSSDEESEMPAAGDDEAEPKKEDEAAKNQRHLKTIRLGQLKRGELVTLLSDLPEEEHDRHIKSAFVLVKVSDKDDAMAEVVCAEPSAPYRVPHADFPAEAKMLKYQLRCKRGLAEKLIKVSAVSNATIEEAHLTQWTKVISRCKIDPDLMLDSLQERASQICRSKTILYDESTVTRILSQKKTIEFDAQKQSRMACQVQIGLTQMDISNIREFEVLKLGKEHEIAKQHLHQMQKKEYEKHEEWFQHARGLFSAKEVNRMNHDRQVRDDKHALQYALDSEKQEDAETGRLNPFERRACRPVSAWDTRLSQSEELDRWKTANVALRQQATRAAEVKLRGTTKASKKSVEDPGTAAGANSDMAEAKQGKQKSVEDPPFPAGANSDKLEDKQKSVEEPPFPAGANSDRVEATADAKKKEQALEEEIQAQRENAERRKVDLELLALLRETYE